MADERLLKSASGAPTADFKAGDGRVMLGGDFDPNSRDMRLEAGYERQVGSNLRLGVQGNLRKNIGPDGASDKPDWGVGIRGRLSFAKGGIVKKGIVTGPFASGGSVLPRSGGKTTK